MSSEEGEITLYGSKDCNACKDSDSDLKSNAKGGIKYNYVDIESHEGQHYLESIGVKEGEHTDIPKIKACKIVKDESGNSKRKCAQVSNYDKDKWNSLKEGRLPDLDYKEES
jgi:glutaredoxin